MGSRAGGTWGAVQESATRALKGGATLDKVLEMVSRVAPELKAPMVLFTYFNPLLCRGFETVMKQIADAGVKGTSVRRASQNSEEKNGNTHPPLLRLHATLQSPQHTFLKGEALAWEPLPKTIPS